MDNFSQLTPDTVLTIVEETLSIELIPFVQSLPSYINRVFEVRRNDETAYVVKFYRPGRWNKAAILDEHEFLFDCEEWDLPVVTPIKTSQGDSLHIYDEIPFAIFPRKAGRDFELYNEENWIRTGSLLARLHNVGCQKQALHRLTLHPNKTTLHYIDILKDHVPGNLRDTYYNITSQIVDTICPHFENIETLRIHGDFHMGNILHRPGEGLMLIDFDDMMNGPAVQDFWLLLPDHYPASRDQLNLLLLGYSDFRDTNPRSAMLIEGLRAMRMIYFTAWSAMQHEDHLFNQNFPNWGSETFWSREISDLQQQFGHIVDSIHEYF